MSENITHKDRLYAEERAAVERFRFDEQVVGVFPDMIRRSVPGYNTIIDMIGVLARRHVQPNTHIYDLGCSLGAATLAMASSIPPELGCRFVAVDNSTAMIEQAQKNLSATLARHHVEWQCADIRATQFKPASVAVLNFTLQFVPKEDRDAFITRLAEAMEPNGILILSEKIAFPDAAEDALQQEWHHDFKRLNGYSDIEISQKRAAIENVLIPEPIAQHEERLLKAGFSKVHLWFRCFNFVSLVAVR